MDFGLTRSNCRRRTGGSWHARRASAYGWRARTAAPGGRHLTLLKMYTSSHLEAARVDDPGEQLSGLADERLAEAVLVAAGGFADERDLGVDRPDAEDGVRAAGEQLGAAVALLDLRCEQLQLVPPGFERIVGGYAAPGRPRSRGCAISSGSPRGTNRAPAAASNSRCARSWRARSIGVGSGAAMLLSVPSGSKAPAAGQTRGESLLRALGFGLRLTLYQRVGRVRPQVGPGLRRHILARPADRHLLHLIGRTEPHRDRQSLWLR